MKDRKKNHWKVRKGLWVFKILNINFIKSKSLIVPLKKKKNKGALKQRAKRALNGNNQSRTYHE